MPRLKAEVTTRTEVDLSPKLVKQIKAKLIEFRLKTKEAKDLKENIAKRKDEFEMLFSDANEYDALKEGVRVDTPFGEVPMKIVGGKTAGKLNLKKLMKKFKLTTQDIESCKDAPKDKKEYLGIWLPDDKEDEGEDDD